MFLNAIDKEFENFAQLELGAHQKKHQETSIYYHMTLFLNERMILEEIQFAERRTW